MASAGQTVYKMAFNAGSQMHAATAPFLFSLEYAGAKPTFPYNRFTKRILASPGANATTANIMKDWLVSFAIYLDPNRNSWSGIRKPFWREYRDHGGDSTQVMSVNYTETGMVDEKYYDRTKRCNFLWKHDSVVQNKR